MSKRQLSDGDTEFVNVLRQKQKMDINLQEKAQKTFAHMMKASRLQSYHTITNLDNQNESIGTCYRCSKSNRRLNTLCFYCEHVVCQGCTQSCN
ncbi:unnamed protein product [Cunninghamella echinulata]